MKKIFLPAVGIDLGLNAIKIAYPTPMGAATASFPAVARLIPLHAEIPGSVSGVAVEINGLRFFVGPDAEKWSVGHAAPPYQQGYSQSAQYQALMLGALSMAAKACGAGAGDEVEIAVLGLGLPLSSYLSQYPKLEQEWTGSFAVPLDGARVIVRVHQVDVLGQPAGALHHWAKATSPDAPEMPTYNSVLVLDAGAGAFSYLFSHSKLIRNPNRSGSNPIGMDYCVRLVAWHLKGDDFESWLLDPLARRRLGSAIAAREPITLPTGKIISVDEYWPLVNYAIDGSLQFMASTVEGFYDLTRVLVVGGAAEIFAQRLKHHFPQIASVLHMVDDPVFANVRGFYARAEALAGKTASNGETIRVQVTPSSSTVDQDSHDENLSGVLGIHA